jgi:hypothetical protein
VSVTYILDTMRLLPFLRPRNQAPSSDAVSDKRRHLKTHCEACGAPTVIRDGVPVGAWVPLFCCTCGHRWPMADRRVSPRPPDA